MFLEELLSFAHEFRSGGDQTPKGHTECWIALFFFDCFAFRPMDFPRTFHSKNDILDSLPKPLQNIPDFSSTLAMNCQTSNRFVTGQSSLCIFAGAHRIFKIRAAREESSANSSKTSCYSSCDVATVQSRFNGNSARNSSLSSS